MGLMELLVGQVTAPSTTLTALTMNSGNSLTVRNTSPQATIMLMQVWVDNQAAGTFRVRGPEFHDNVQGMRFDITASEVDPLIPWGITEKLKPQQTIIAELSGSGTAADIESAALLLYYSDIPGLTGRYITPEEVTRRKESLMTVENTLSLGTAGGYSGEEAINAEFDLWEANRDYALVGYLVDGEAAAIRWRGTDTGNLGIGGPGNEVDRQLTNNWFAMLSKTYGMPLIPVFNSANKASILIDGHQDENGTDVTVTSIFALLT